jgi:hypothetical protein
VALCIFEDFSADFIALPDGGELDQVSPMLSKDATRLIFRPNAQP